MNETRDIRLKRLKIRSWRRGTREMDLLLGGYADDALEALDDGALEAIEALLEAPDQDLYAWISGSAAADPEHAPMVDRIQRHHGLAS